MTIGEACTLLMWHDDVEGRMGVGLVGGDGIIRYGIKLLHFELFQFAFLSRPRIVNPAIHLRRRCRRSPSSRTHTRQVIFIFGNGEVEGEIPHFPWPHYSTTAAADLHIGHTVRPLCSPTSQPPSHFSVHCHFIPPIPPPGYTTII